MSDPLEHELLERAKGGDREAMDRLLQTVERRLYNICLRMVSNRDDAAEVTQETFLKIIEHLGDYRGQAELSTWMIRIAMNESISHLRKRRLRKTTSLDGPAHLAGYATGPSNDGQYARIDSGVTTGQQMEDRREPGPLQRVQDLEMLDLLRITMAGLDDEFRAVLVLRDIEELDYEQIANVLGLKIGTVKSRLFRARLTLRQEMGHLTADPSNVSGARTP